MWPHKTAAYWLAQSDNRYFIRQCILGSLLDTAEKSNVFLHNVPSSIFEVDVWLF